MKEKSRKKILDLIKTLAAVAPAVIIGLIFFAPHRGKPVRNLPLLMALIALAVAIAVFCSSNVQFA
jgi:hypothetical protein